MYALIATILKYVFIFIIYIFIFTIIRMIYLDISFMKGYSGGFNGACPYLKLISRREKFKFKIQESYILDEDKSFGRSSRSDIVIQDPYLSKKHVQFTVQEGNCFIKDMDSTNGTFVNGENIGQDTVLLKNGDIIHIGQLDFIFVSQEQEENL